MTRDRLLAAAVLATAAALFLARLGDRAVVSEEVRWAEVAREMRAAGDYLHPTLNGRTYYDKPVGSYWLIVLASRLTGGVDETAARLPAAVAGWAGVLLVVWLGRRLFDAPTGLLAGAVLATSYGYLFYSRRATADTETVTGVLAAVCLYERCRAADSRRWVVGLWLLMAVTSLTKGLLGFALPAAVLLTHATWAGWPAVVRANRWLVNPWTLLAAPLGVGLYLLPFLLSVQQTGATDGLAMVWRENVRRFVNPHNHVGPPYLYLGVVWVLAAPWAAFLPAALVPRRGEPDRLARAYFWAVFLLFTAAASRRSYYLLPVLPAAALLVARVLTAPAGELRPVAVKLRTAGWAVCGAGFVATAAAFAPAAWRPAPYEQLPELPARGWLLAGWLLAAVAVGVAVRRPGWRPWVLAAVAAAGYAYAFGVVLPAADGLRTRRAFAAEVRRLTDPDPDKLALFRARDAVFELDRVVPEFATEAELVEAVRAGRVRWVLARRRYLDGLSLPMHTVAEEPSRPWEAADQAGDKLVLADVGGG